MQGYNFNGPNRIIHLDNTSSFEIKDAYSRWKEWVMTGSNAMYPQAFSYVGGEPTTPGNYLGSTYFLKNNWKFQPTSSNHILDVVGNIYTDDVNSPNVFITTSGNFNVTIRNSISNLTDVIEVDAISGAIVTAMQSKLKDLWQVHGLDSGNPLTVTNQNRSAGDVNQNISTGSNITVVTRI